MAINFPGSPTNNQTFTSGGITWIYSTAIGAWKIVPNTITGTQGVQGLQGIQGISNQGVQGTQGPQGLQGLQGLSVQGTSGTTQGIQGLQGIQGTSVQGTFGFQGLQGSSSTATSINATDDTSTTTLYPVMVGAAGSAQTAKVTTSKLTFNALTGGLNVTDLTTSGAATFSGGITSGFTVRKQNTTGEGGEFYLQKSDTSTLSGNLVIDLVGNTFRIFESGSPNKGVAIDISAQGSQATLLTSSNYNSYPPTNLSTTNINWSTNGTVSAVVGQLAWKNYGNGHTIFDASANTSPSGTALPFGRENAEVPWTASYPTLMGWNTGNTFGVRVDSARLADNSTLSNGKRITVSATAPGSPAVGDIWVDTA